MNFQYLVIEGPIGAGKTTLAERLARAFRGRALLDRPGDNPYLEAFYDGVPGAAFRTQLHFLAERATALKALTRDFPANECVVSDFLLEKDKIFASLTLDDQELTLYRRLYDAVADYIITPDLVIFLKASLDRLLERIASRNLPMESKITPSYLEDLNEAYHHFFFQYMQRTRVPVLVVESSQVNFASSEGDLDDLANYLRLKNVVGMQYYAPSGKVLQ